MSHLTKKALDESMVELLNTTTLDKITIGDITNACGVSRQTFYYHFEDIYDLLEWHFMNEADTIMNAFPDKSQWAELASALANYMISNKSLIRNIYNSIGRELLEATILRTSTPFIEERITAISEEYGLNLTKDDIGFYSKLTTYAFSGIMLDWIKSGMKDDPDIFISKIKNIENNAVKMIRLYMQRSIQ